jgi:hypothetical protein
VRIESHDIRKPGVSSGALVLAFVPFAVAMAWIGGLGLVLVFLPKAPRRRFPIVGDSDDTDFWKWWRSESP